MSNVVASPPPAVPIAIIHAVSVVPMLAPIITDMACANVSKPALTKDTVMTVVAVDDWTETVTSIPVRTPVKRLVVIAPSTCRNCGPANFCKASLMDFIPNMSSAREPNNLKIISKDINKIMLNYHWCCKCKKNLGYCQIKLLFSASSERNGKLTTTFILPL